MRITLENCAGPHLRTVKASFASQDDPAKQRKFCGRSSAPAGTRVVSPLAAVPGETAESLQKGVIHLLSEGWTSGEITGKLFRGHVRYTLAYYGFAHEAVKIGEDFYCKSCAGRKFDVRKPTGQS